MKIPYLSFAFASFVLVASASATTRTVNSTADDQGNGCSTAPGGCTLREAIEASLDNDTIDFAASLNGAAIGLRGTELGIVHNLTIIGPRAGLTIDGGSLSRIFNVRAGTVTLSNLTIAGGQVKGVRGGDAFDFTTPAQPGGDEYGGGIRNAGTLTLTNCRVIYNRVFGGHGGNGRSDGPNSFGGNGGAGRGGGIANLGSLTLLNCTVSDNYAFGGAGGITYGFRNTRSAAGGNGNGGGIFSSQDGSTLIMTGCTLSGNAAVGGPGAVGGKMSKGGHGGFAWGGGLYSNAPTTTLKLCTLSDNEAEGGVGGAPGPYADYDFPEGQGGSSYGGGIYTSSELTLLSCTLSNNLARGGLAGPSDVQRSHDGEGAGGGLYGGGCTIRNTIIAGNSVDSTFNEVGPDVTGEQSSEGYNFIGNTGDNGDHSVSSGWVVSDFTGSLGTPLDPGLGPLQDNGGPTFTRGFLDTSTAIDKGDDAVLSAPFNLTTDQRGPGYPRKIGAHVDIGAFEHDPPQSAPALVVNTTDEHSDGVCGVLDCSLWDAAGAASANPDISTINFKAGLSGTITTKLYADGINLVSQVTINGPGARILTISGSESGRLFKISTTSVATITGLTLANARYANDGGAILNNGQLTLINCAVLNNKADGGGAGGGVYNATSKTLTITNCTFANNQASSYGGGVSNGAGSVVISNSTFSGNSASRGGAVAGTSLTLRFCTISGNRATSSSTSYGGGVFNGSDYDNTLYLSNTVIAGNTATDGPDLFGAIISQDYNLFGNPSGATLTGPTTHNITGVSPRLGTLQNNGGPTNTMALLPGSPALDKGKNVGLATDQRGLARPSNDPTIANAPGGDGSDIGAFEKQPPPPTPTPTPTPKPTATPTATPKPTATPTATATAIATPTPTPTATPKTVLANISTRLKVETGDNTLIGGFIITGTQPKKVIIRAIGPSLSVPGKLANPTLELRNSAGTLLKANDDWKNSSAADKQAIINSTIPPTNDLESAIVATLPANSAGYTAIVRGVNNTTGFGVVEMYDLDRNVDSKLANISTRGLVQRGDTVLIAGTIVLGPSSQKVIIRAIGPSLSIPGKLANPTLELRNASGTLLDANDNWKNSANKQAIINSTVPPTNDLESAIVATLPGNGASYTAIVRGVNNTTGIAVVEVYALK